MTKLKVGDRFIPRKPKDTSQSPMWDRTMDKLDGCALTFARYKLDGTLLSKEYPFYAFHPGWCEKVEENHIPDVGKMVDWEQRRYELAKAAMQSIVTNSSMLNLVASKGERSMVDWTVIVCQNAIIMADEMIKQLKQR